MKKFLKNDLGISGIDLITSIGIVMIFTMVITMVYTNLITANVKIQRTQIATNYAVALMEKADKFYYNELTKDELKSNMNFSKNYDVDVDVIEQDSKKKVTVNISFSIGKKNKEVVKMEKTKTKEVLDNPNKAILEKSMVFAIYDDVYNKVGNNTKLYSYSQNVWAAYAKDINENVYVWIPRYAFLDNDIKFIFGKGRRFLNSQGNLQTLSSDYSIFDDFVNKDGIWVDVTEFETNSVSKKII